MFFFCFFFFLGGGGGKEATRGSRQFVGVSSQSDRSIWMCMCGLTKGSVGKECQEGVRESLQETC